VPAPPPPPPAPVASNWMHAPLTPGDWTWRREGADSIAEFRAPGGQVVAQLACAAASRQVFLSLSGWPAGNATIRTETTERVVAANPGGAGARVTFGASDSLLDAMAFSRGRIAVEGEARALYLPSYPELTRVVGDCR